MSPTDTQNLINDINQYVRNYPLQSFQNLRLNSILLRLANGGTGGGGGGSGFNPVPVTSANFTTATDCPLIALNGLNLLIFFNESQKFIYQETGDWTPLVGGGFTILIPGFDSTTANYHFVVYVIS